MNLRSDAAAADRCRPPLLLPLPLAADRPGRRMRRTGRPDRCAWPLRLTALYVRRLQDCATSPAPSKASPPRARPASCHRLTLAPRRASARAERMTVGARASGRRTAGTSTSARRGALSLVTRRARLRRGRVRAGRAMRRQPSQRKPAMFDALEMSPGKRPRPPRASVSRSARGSRVHANASSPGAAASGWGRRQRPCLGLAGWCSAHT